MRNLIFFLNREKIFFPFDFTLFGKWILTEDYILSFFVNLQSYLFHNLAFTKYSLKISKNFIDINTIPEIVLERAIYARSVNEIKYLILKKNKSLNMNIYDGILLRTSIKEGNLPLVKFLINKGADLNKVTKLEITSLFKFGHKEVIKYLYTRRNLFRNIPFVFSDKYFPRLLEYLQN